MNNGSLVRSVACQVAAYCLSLLMFLATVTPTFAQARISMGAGRKAPATKKEANKAEAEKAREAKEKKEREAQRKLAPDEEKGEMTGERIDVPVAATVPTYEIMQAQKRVEGKKTTREKLEEQGIRFEVEGPDRTNLAQNPDAPAISQYPVPTESQKKEFSIIPEAPQTIGLNFDTVTGPAETGAFPPDTMGAAGPTQFVLFVNGRLRSFDKSTGIADGVLNANPDVFFNSVLTPPTATNFTSDPNVRYDRLTGRWFLTIIDVPGGAGAIANRLLIAVSDASSSTITGATVWTFYQFVGSTTFLDYPSLGIDASALYIGGNMFTLGGSFAGTDAWVVPKAPALTASPLTVWHFTGLAGASTAGPYSPRGVDNVDPANTGPTATGYFIGVDNVAFSLLQFRRVTDPGNTGFPQRCQQIFRSRCQLPQLLAMWIIWETLAVPADD